MANSSIKARRGAGSVICFSANSVRSTGSASLAPRDFSSCQGHFIHLVNVRGVNIEDTGNLINGADLLVHSLDNPLSEFEGIRLHAVNLIRLPQQCSKLNAMDHILRELKGHLSAKPQFKTIDGHAEHATYWALRLSNRQALHKAGV